MIGVVDIIAAKQAWETTAWSSLGLVSFKYFPTQDDLDTGLVKTPFICHQVESSTAESVSINHLGSVEDIQTHKVWTYIMYAKGGDPQHAIAQRDAVWRDRYRTEHLLHLMNSMANGGGIQVNEMGAIEPLVFDLFGVEWIGIKIPNTITIRQLMQTAN